MVQMTPADQAIVKALPGNDVCADCPTQRPDWASLSMGTLICLDCSGVHRSLGVHISFVRSVAMDSWTPPQLQMMRTGGNSKCNAYLKAKGVAHNTPIKQKYESDHAQLYKEVLKARAEGRPEPTELPKKKAPSSGNYRPMTSISSSAGSGGGGGGDPNGMERLAGESDEQYVARQTRLRSEAKVRMAAKFGGGGMGGVGSEGMRSSRMGGVGSDPRYTPGGGYGGGAGDFDVNAVAGSVVSGLGSAFGALSTAASSVSAVVQDEGTRAQAAQVASSFWGGLSVGATNFVNSVTAPDDDGDDGLGDLQRQFHSQAKPNSKYSGFGSDSLMGGFSSAGGISTGTFNTGGFGSTPAQQPYTTSSAMSSASTLTEARAGPGEDPNGIERLSGESDEQYVMRQTRLRDEAKARMAAKFGGGGGMGGVGSGGFGSAPAHQLPAAAAPSAMSLSSTLTEARAGPGEDLNGIERLSGESDEQYVMRQTRLRDEAKARMAAKFGGGGGMGGVGNVGNSYSNRVPAAPRSAPLGNFNSAAVTRQSSSKPPSSGNSVKVTSGDDFFANFGT